MRRLPDAVIYDLRAVTHLALHGAGFIEGDDGHEDDEGMQIALRRIEEEVTEESMHRWRPQ